MTRRPLDDQSDALRGDALRGDALRGRIVRGVGGLYSVYEAPRGAGGDRYVLCAAKGVFRKNEVTPLVGDEVEFETETVRKEYGNIVKILKRRSELQRPPVANVDRLLIVMTLSVPAPDFLLADKLIIQALKNGITPVLCFNKSDLPSIDEYAADEDGYRRAGFTTLRASVSDAASLKALAAELSGKVTILAGQSGVGKSTLFNGILEDRKMEVGEMSGRIGRGRHTTRHVELTALKEGGWLVDSPGFSLFETEIGNYRELDLFYPEYAPYRGSCRFKECSHTHEPDCAVLGALLSGKLHPGRHARYTALYKAYRLADARRYSR